HNTRLFVSFDSPNLGANIPMALQSTVYFNAYVRKNESSQEVYEKNLNSIAARQLLIHQLDHIIQNLYPYSTHRYQWQSMINNYGFPENLRKVALINGRTLGLTFDGCSTMLDYDVTKAGAPFQGTWLATLQLKHLS